MAVALAEFTSLMGANPALLTIPLLTLGVIFVNGWTDAPNAIATCVATRSMRPRAAIAMATVFNFLGVTVMTYINATVAQTIYNMVDFSGESLNALIALGAALLAIIIWATAAWWFGIPTSESHALIAGVSGAAIALQGGISGINGSEWIKVITGLGFSTGMGFASGWFIVKTIETLCGGVDRRKTFGAFKNAQIFAAGSVAMRYAKSNVVTARVDEIQFHLPIYVGSLVTVTATIAYVGRTSMEVIVFVDVEDLQSTAEPMRALSAFFTLVALDKDGHPRPVPPLQIETEEEKMLYNSVKRRRESMHRERV
jgi:acyl-CoA hydrolase